MKLSELMHLPIVASSQGQDIDFMIYLVHILMFVLLIGWGGFFLTALIRFRRGRNPKANYGGVQ